MHFAACTIPLGTFELYAPGCEKKSVYKGQTMTREQYHVQINLFFFASTSLPEMKVTGKLPGKEMIIWFASKKEEEMIIWARKSAANEHPHFCTVLR